MNSPATIEELVSENRGLVHRVAQLMTAGMGPETDRDAVISDGMLGLFNAAKHFDPAKAQFSTYAWCAIKRTMQRGFEVRDHIKRAHHKRTDLFKPTLSFVGANLVHDAMLTQTPDRAGRRLSETRETKELIDAILPLLDQRERLVLKLRYYRGQTLEQIGRRLGVTKERIRQLEVKALAQLRVALKLRDLAA